MDLVLIIRKGGLKEPENQVLKTLVGTHLTRTAPVSVHDNVNWYAEFSIGDPKFNQIKRTSTIQTEADSGCAKAENFGGKPYNVQYNIVTPEEAKQLIEESGGYRR